METTSDLCLNTMTSDESYNRWLDDCLAEYNEKYGVNRTIHTITEDDYDPDQLVAFSEMGSAYPHSTAGGTNWVPNAVTPWADSEHYVPLGTK